MTTETKTIKVEIPKNYLGFENGLSYEFKSDITVLTGFNGSGKSRLLQWILNDRADKKSIFSKSPFNDFLTNRDINETSRVRYGRDEKQLRDVEDIIRELEEFCNRFLRSKLGYPPPTVTFWEDMLFHKETEVFQYRDELLRERGTTRFRAPRQFFDIIIEATGADETEVFNEFGIFTEAQIINKIAESIVSQRRNAKIKRKNSKNLKKDISIIKNAIYVLLQKIKLSTISEDKKNDFSEEEQKQIVDTANNTKKIKELEAEEKLENKITSRSELEEFIHRKLNPMGDSIDALIEKLEAQIQKDHNGKRKDSSNTLLKINARLKENEGMGQFFKFKIKEPTDHSSYKLRFQYKDEKNLSEVMFRDLSTGEKVLFELVAIGESLKAKNQLNIKLILLDEFDANLNPSLVSQYLNEIRNLAKQGIRIILTTHNPSTVAEINPTTKGSVTEDLCWIENGKIKSVNDGDIKKKEILETLAPKFTCDEELDFVGVLTKSRRNILVFCEGETDVSHLNLAREVLEKQDIYQFINCRSGANIPHILKAIKTIPLLKDLVKDKIVIGLWDFDQEGKDQISSLLDKNYKRDATSNNLACAKELENKIEDKNDLIFKYEIETDQGKKEYLNLMLLTPNTPESKFWITHQFTVEHLYQLDGTNFEKINQGFFTKVTAPDIYQKPFPETDVTNANYLQSPWYFKPGKNKTGFFDRVKSSNLEQDWFTPFKKIFEMIDKITDSPCPNTSAIKP